MSLTTQPTQITTWATDGAALKLAPTTVEETFGWTTSDNTITGIPVKPNLQSQNYWQYSVHLWQLWARDNLVSTDADLNNNTGTGLVVRNAAPTFTGTAAFTNFTGNWTSGTGSGDRITSQITGTGNVVKATGGNFGGTFTGTHSSGSVTGSIVGTGINATNITTGGMSAARINGGSWVGGVGGTFTGNHSSGTVSGAIVGSGISATNITTGTLSGSLVGTGINATNITTGQMSATRMGAGAWTGTVTGTFGGAHTSGSVTGSIVGTGINALNITSNSLSTNHGGTGIAGGITTGRVLVGNGTSPMTLVATIGSGNFVRAVAATSTGLSTFDQIRVRETEGITLGIHPVDANIMFDQRTGVITNGWMGRFFNDNSTVTSNGLLVEIGNNSSAAILQLNSFAGSPRFLVEGSGVMSVDATSWSSSGAQDIGISSGGYGNFQKFTSARKYKTEIREYDGGSEWIYDLVPHFFRYKSQAEMRGGDIPSWIPQSTNSVRYMADDVKKIAPKEFVFFNEDKKTGKLTEESLHYKLFVVPIIEQLAKHDSMIKELAGI